MNRQEVTERLKSNKEKYFKQFGARLIGLFGSCARDEANKKSDIDILYEIEKNKKLSLFACLKLIGELEKDFHAKIDLARTASRSKRIPMFRRWFFASMVGSVALCFAGDLMLLDHGEDSDVVQVQMQKGRDVCKLWVDSAGGVERGSCHRAVNSRHTIIYCTPRKKLCKTQQEVRDFVMALLVQPGFQVKDKSQHNSGYQACVDNSGGVTSRLVACNQAELQYQEILLNSTYQKTMQRLDPKHQRELKRVQQLWIQYRDAKCAFLSDLTGGTLDILNTGSCYIDTTVLRIQELSRLFP